MFARRLVIFVEFGNIDEAKPRLFEAYPQSVEFLRVVINEEVTPKQVTVRIPTRLSDFGETEIATLRFAKLRRSTSREPKDSPIATERPASPGPHREAGGTMRIAVRALVHALVMCLLWMYRVQTRLTVDRQIVL